MLQNVLLPTDFSNNSWSAIRYAQELFQSQDCTFHLLHSVALKVSTMSNFSNRLLRVMIENAKEDIKEFEKRMQQFKPKAKHRFNIILSTEDLLAAINTALGQNNIDLVVMGTKGATGAKEIIFGSNTVSVIKKLKSCALLVVPEKYNYVPLKQIAFPTDFKRSLDEKSIGLIKEMARIHNAKIRVLHIHEEEALNSIQENNYDYLKAFLLGYKYSFHWMPEYSKKQFEIKQFVQDLEIDVLAMINYKKSWLEHLVREPVIKRIGSNPFVPFLVIPNQNHQLESQSHHDESAYEHVENRIS